jgi:arginase
VIAPVAAPTNLGLRPPQPSSVPGCAKAPEALHEAGLHARLVAAAAVDAGVVLPGRYVDDGDPAAGRVRNQDALIDHSRRLATRLEHLLAAGHSPLVLGGDCSLLVGAGLALRRRGGYGLVHIDGHTDFRHPGNSPVCLSLAGEVLAAAVLAGADVLAGAVGGLLVGPRAVDPLATGVIGLLEANAAAGAGPPDGRGHGSPTSWPLA